MSGQAESSFWSEAIEEPEFVVAGLGLGQARTILILHAERNLGKVIRIAASDDRTRTREVQLEPCCAVRGRLLDALGEPIARVRLQAHTEPSENFGPYLNDTVTTDSEGRFEFTSVPPGCKYRLTGRSPDLKFRIRNLQFEAKPGEAIDLGALTVGNDGAVTSVKREIESNSNDLKQLGDATAEPRQQPVGRSSPQGKPLGVGGRVRAGSS